MKGILLLFTGKLLIKFQNILKTLLKLSYDIGFVYRRTDEHGETSIPPYNFVEGGIMTEILLKVALNILYP
jgi:hypothetical protein